MAIKRESSNGVLKEINASYKGDPIVRVTHYDEAKNIVICFTKRSEQAHVLRPIDIEGDITQVLNAAERINPAAEAALPEVPELSMPEPASTVAQDVPDSVPAPRADAIQVKTEQKHRGVRIPWSAGAELVALARVMKIIDPLNAFQSERIANYIYDKYGRQH